MSFGSTSPTLSDRNKFPLFFRTIAPESSRNSARVAFINYFKWKTVTTFSESENYYLLPLNNLIAHLERSNISCFAIITFSIDNYKEQLRVLKVIFYVNWCYAFTALFVFQESDTRIIIGSFSKDIAPNIFCEVIYLGLK